MSRARVKHSNSMAVHPVPDAVKLATASRVSQRGPFFVVVTRCDLLHT